MSPETEWAWAAGFCEGEASIIARKRKDWVGIQMLVPQVHRGPLDRLMVLFQFGNVAGPVVVSGHQPIWRFQASGDRLIEPLEHIRQYGSVWFQEKIDRVLKARRDWKGLAA